MFAGAYRVALVLGFPGGPRRRARAAARPGARGGPEAERGYVARRRSGGTSLVGSVVERLAVAFDSITGNYVFIRLDSAL